MEKLSKWLYEPSLDRSPGALTKKEIKTGFLENWSINIEEKFSKISFRHSITNYKLLCNLIIPRTYKSVSLKTQVLKAVY